MTAACNGAGEKERRQLGRVFGQQEQRRHGRQRRQLDEQPAAKYSKDIFLYEGK